MAKDKDNHLAPPARGSTARTGLALGRIALLAGLPADVLDRIAQACEWQMLAAQRTLFTRAQPGGDVSFLVSGRLRITTYSAQGRQVTFRDCEAGAHLGDLSAFDRLPRSADVVALEPSLVARLPADAFLSLCRQEPLVAERIVRHLTAMVRELSERVIELSTLGVHNRLHAELLRLARATGAADGGPARIAPAPTHQELASRISTNREQVTRELGVLRRRGLLRTEGRALVITDVARLAQMVAEVRGG